MTTINPTNVQPLGCNAMPSLDSVEGLQAPVLSNTPTSEAPVVHDVAASSAAATPLGSDLALTVLELLTKDNQVNSKHEVSEARSNRQKQIESLQNRLEEIAKMAKEQAKAKRRGRLGKIFKWIAAAAAAIAGAIGSVFSGGATAGVAAVVIALIVTADSAAKAVGDLLVDLGVDPKIAKGISAALGALDQVVASLAEAGVLGPKGEVVAKAFTLAVDAALTVLSCVFSGGSGALKVVSSICAITADVVDLAKVAYEAVIEERGTELNEDAQMAMQIIAIVLELAAAACSVAQASSGDNESLGAQVAQNASGWTKIAASGTSAGFELAEGLAQSAAQEAEAMSEKEAALADTFLARLKDGHAVLKQLLDEIMDVRADVDTMIQIDGETAMAAFSPMARA